MPGEGPRWYYDRTVVEGGIWYSLFLVLGCRVTGYRTDYRTDYRADYRTSYRTDYGADYRTDYRTSDRTTL